MLSHLVRRATTSSSSSSSSLLLRPLLSSSSSIPTPTPTTTTTSPTPIRTFHHSPPSTHPRAGYYGYGSASTPGLDALTMHGTTILCVRKGNKVVMMGDGQVSQGSTVVKPNAKKVRRIGENIVAGFAGSTADCFTLMERLERKLEEHPGQLTRACVDLAKAWRTDKYLRRLEASLLVADGQVSFEITGLGDVLEPKDGVIAIGSGGTLALAAAKALIDRDDLDAEQIAKKAMEIAAEMCVYTNNQFVTEVVDGGKDGGANKEGGAKEGEKGGNNKKDKEKKKE